MVTSIKRPCIGCGKSFELEGCRLLNERIYCYSCRPRGQLIKKCSCCKLEFRVDSGYLESICPACVERLNEMERSLRTRCFKCKKEFPTTMEVKIGSKFLCHKCFKKIKEKQMFVGLAAKLHGMVATYQTRFGCRPSHIDLGPKLFETFFDNLDVTPEPTPFPKWQGITVTQNFLLADHAITLRQAVTDTNYWSEHKKHKKGVANLGGFKPRSDKETKDKTIIEKITRIQSRIANCQMKGDRHGLDRTRVAIDELTNVIAEDSWRVEKALTLLTSVLEKLTTHAVCLAGKDGQ